MNKQQLAARIWESANKMRSKIEANEYKDYILVLGTILLGCIIYWNYIIGHFSAEKLQVTTIFQRGFTLPELPSCVVSRASFFSKTCR